MIFASGTCLRTPSTMRFVGSTDQRWNSRGGSTPAQVSKICSTSAPACELPEQILDRIVDDGVDDPGERVGVAISHHPRRRLVRRALTRNHVSRDCPWCPAESDQRDFGASSRRTRRSASNTGSSLVKSPDEASVPTFSGVSSGSSRGPSPTSNLTSRPSA